MQCRRQTDLVLLHRSSASYGATNDDNHRRPTKSPKPPRVTTPDVTESIGRPRPPPPSPKPYQKPSPPASLPCRAVRCSGLIATIQRECARIISQRFRTNRPRISPPNPKKPVSTRIAVRSAESQEPSCVDRAGRASAKVGGITAAKFGYVDPFLPPRVSTELGQPRYYCTQIVAHTVLAPPRTIRRRDEVLSRSCRDRAPHPSATLAPVPPRQRVQLDEVKPHTNSPLRARHGLAAELITCTITPVPSPTLPPTSWRQRGAHPLRRPRAHSSPAF